MNDVTRNRKWNALLRVAGFLAAIGGMYISAKFSVAGFEFSLSGTEWVGWSIAIIIIVLESVWQKFGKNRTLFAIALGCYFYGVSTNIVGIIQAKGGTSNVNFLDYAVALFFGVLFEVFPEPLLAWSISGDTSSDPLGAFLDGLDGEYKPTYQRLIPSQNNTVSNKHNGHKPDYKFTSFGKDNKPQGKVDPRKVMSNIFNDNYTGKFKR